MKKLDFAKLIISGRDFEVKSRNFGGAFGECRIINGEDFIVLYDETEAPAVEIARWRKEYFAKYLRYLARVFDWAEKDNDRLFNISDYEGEKQCAMLDAIFEFINIDENDIDEGV